MATIQLLPDFKEFLKLLSSHQVKYLMVGGYAVGYYGYPRATADMDLWVDPSPENAKKLVAALHEFGFNVPQLSEDLFLKPNQVIRMGNPPVRIELLTSISGVDFKACFKKRKTDLIDEVEVHFIGLDELKANKQASGRHKDLDDLEHLS